MREYKKVDGRYSDVDIEEMVRSVDGTMRMEGLVLTDAEKNILRAIGRGEMTGDGVAAQVRLEVGADHG